MDHRRLGIDLYNGLWPLLEQPSRTSDEDELLVIQAHASAFHWLHAGTAENFARSEWMLARVYAAVGRPEPALFHARRCVELATPIGDWDLMAAHEVLARALLVNGQPDAARESLATGRAVSVADDEDRAQIEQGLDEVEALLA